MKKSLVLIVFSLMMASCCSRSYRVEGKIYGAADSTKVTLFCYTDNGLSPKDSAFVMNESFLFKGETDTCQIALLSFSVDGINSDACSFFLEAGKIAIEYANGIQKISGTHVNEQNQLFMDKIYDINNRATPIEYEIQRATTEEESRAAMAKMQELQDEYIDILKHSVESNLDNHFGLQQLLENYQLFETDNLVEIVTGMKQTFESDTHFKQFEEYVMQRASIGVGKEFIDVEEELIDGDKRVKLSDVVKENKLVLLDFWASWCGPCRREIPTMKAAYEKYHSQGFEIVSISVDDDREAWKSAVKEENMSWIQLINGNADNSAATLYHIEVIPTLFLINNEGIIVATNTRGAALEEAIIKHLN